MGVAVWSTWLLALRVFACFASANIAYTFDIPNGACSLKRSLRRKRLMLNTVSGVSAVNGSSVYLWTELYAKYWSDVRRQRSNSFWAARGGISSP